MNIQVRKQSRSATTQAAEGLMRRKWSVAEIEAMVTAGIIAEHERIELIGGEVVPMSPKGIRHELVKTTLNRYWAARLPNGIIFAQETTFRLDEHAFVEPDFVFYRQSDGLAGLKPETCLLAVEVADTSLDYDLKRKARIYATHGVREVWVINAVSLLTHVHRAPGLDGYGDIREIPAGDTLEMTFAPQLNLALGRLELI